MITITKSFTTAQEMEDFIKSYFKEFHPAGYGTSIKEVEILPIYDTGIFQYINYEVTLSRAESCD